MNALRARWTPVAGLALVAVAGLFRLTGLEHNPPGLWQDEASTAVDAYFLWHTAHDRAGAFLPVIARSFGDYPLALYRYLDAPIVGLAGMTPGHERLVAAVAGTIMIAALGVWMRSRLGHAVALCAMLSAALCPTWIHFSRYGSEGILLPASLVLGVTFIDLGRHVRRRPLIWVGAATLALSAYTYHTVKLVLPLWMLGFLTYEWPLVRELWHRERRHVIGPALLFLIMAMPSAMAAVTSGGMARVREVAVWYHYPIASLPAVVARTYASYFAPAFLFWTGGSYPAQSIPGAGLWNLIDYPLMVAGFVTMSRRQSRFDGFILYWFLLGPLPGGVATEAQNVGRVISWLPAPQIVSGVGLAAIFSWARAAGWPRHAAAVTGALVAAGWIATAVHIRGLVFDRYPVETPLYWQFEVSAALRCARDHRLDERIIVSPQFYLADVFAHFWLDEIASPAAWSLGERRRVEAGELYVFPAGQLPPEGHPLCSVGLPDAPPLAFVFDARSSAGR